MTSPRLTHALDTGALTLSEMARCVVIEPRPESAVSAVPCDEVQVQTQFRPSFEAFQAQGFPVARQVEGFFDVAIVVLPRVRQLARALLNEAVRLAPGGLILVDGAKTDGVDSLLKAVKSRVSVTGQVSKAHGKLFWFPSGNKFDDWAMPAPMRVSDGWVTLPGVFSSDGVDPGSRALAAALPKSMKGRVADLGAGWGYLGHAVLQHADVSHVALVEADGRALDCARRNLEAFDRSDRVAFHWQDATRWGDDACFDWVVMNPPFHSGRAPDVSLGLAFIGNAARILRPGGRLMMVANRHLPYEKTLAGHFAVVDELTGDARFKILKAEKPKPQRG